MRYTFLIILLASLASCVGAQPVVPHACLMEGSNTFNCQVKQMGY